MFLQHSLLNIQEKKFPSTRYQGSKAKLVDWVWQKLQKFEFNTFLDAFGGTGCVAYKAKQRNKQVAYNDILKFNSLFAEGLIENNEILLSDSDIAFILKRHDGFSYSKFIEESFKDIYYTDLENQWLDQTIQNINLLENRYKKGLAFFALAQACIIKRPYNLFHRKNLYVRLSNVTRSFGNKTTWDRPFEYWFKYFTDEANSSIFDNGFNNKVFCQNATTIKSDFDLVYFDPPYMNQKGISVDYRDFYHFLEGLTEYKNWDRLIDKKSKHLRLKREVNPWSNKTSILHEFEELIKNFKMSTIAISYRSDGIPSEEKIVDLVRQYKSHVETHHYGPYKYALSKNNKSKELLIIGS